MEKMYELQVQRYYAAQWQQPQGDSKLTVKETPFH